MSWESLLKMPRISDSGHKMVKIKNGLYEYRTFTVEPNTFGEFGLPKTAWIVSYNDKHINPAWNLKEAMEEIDHTIQDPHTKGYEHLRTDEEKERF